ncbi:hypothetical protein [Thermococcus celer]|uniref:Uncharacterized protein n=1 Tax=Thermococcus celer Vu 13 = JCM 8558 TaxID=1293037 RepID=A0A218P0B6_THECE|nr:hypothetical protein [Thermococcus celer]ASI98346.1 hypothetical protein A3L02_01565 [Thermococcus celer Vu 13 = JCM 8558]
MRKGQISLDFLFAVTLIAITMVNLVHIASIEQAHSEAFDTVAKLKAFSIDVRDTVVKAYAVGDGFTVRKRLPIELDSGDEVTIKLIAPSNITIDAYIGGESYHVVQRAQVPIYKNSKVTLTATNMEFNVTATYNEAEGRVDVVLSS